MLPLRCSKAGGLPEMSIYGPWAVFCSKSPRISEHSKTLPKSSDSVTINKAMFWGSESSTTARTFLRSWRLCYELCLRSGHQRILFSRRSKLRVARSMLIGKYTNPQVRMQVTLLDLRRSTPEFVVDLSKPSMINVYWSTWPRVARWRRSMDWKAEAEGGECRAHRISYALVARTASICSFCSLSPSTFIYFLFKRPRTWC